MEPSASCFNEDSDSTVTTDITEENEATGDTTLFVPVKKGNTSNKRQKVDPVLKTVDLLKSVIENDPTKEFIKIMKEEMQQSREQDIRYFQMLCGVMTSHTNNTHFPQNQMFVPHSLSHPQAPSPNHYGTPHSSPNVSSTPYSLGLGLNAMFHNTDDYGSQPPISQSISPESQPQFQQL